MLERLIIALTGLATAALPALAQQEITRHERIANWALFEDRGYCWMATNTRLPGSDRLMLTVDLDESVSMFIDFADGTIFDDAADHALFLGPRKVLFRSRGEWAWTYRDSPERLVETILESAEIGFEVHLADAGDMDVLKGHWETRDAQLAYDTLRASCGR
ncbi:hypothetical protein PVW46_19920 [Mameliella sp. AT18]|uniref:hypothetical protein n=1 Tax=Mameliella sp. AT18 TaxID=3028385 RepID=UPI00084101EA|nr:hypothetical protein [Mameliella sp. AT18]MDD9732174.1 hypothetical protein [Mameliella sp. AT18]ODM48614.1 hypothetical protein A9320_02715 [Ruegeria sp. PBVC088]